MDSNDGLQRLRQVGFFTKGTVYCLLGALVVLAALGLGGDVEGKEGVMRFLLGIPMGKVLVVVVACGLLAYSLWRFYSAYRDPKSDSKDRRWGSKLRYVYSGLFYGAISLSFAKSLFGGSSSGGDKKKAVLAQLLDKDWGQWLIMVIAGLVAGQAVFQAYVGYTGKFMKKIDDHPGRAYRLVKNTGRVGYYARCIVFGVLSYFLFRVVADHNANTYDGTKGVFQYLLTFDFGNVLMGALALGLLAYGIFTILVGRYSNLTQLS